MAPPARRDVPPVTGPVGTVTVPGTDTDVVATGPGMNTDVVQIPGEQADGTGVEDGGENGGGETELPRLAAPTGVTAGLQGGAVVVSWTGVAATGGQQVQYSVRGTGGLTQMVTQPLVARFPSPGPGTYAFTVEAAAAGHLPSAVSQASAPLTLGPVVGPPGPVTNLREDGNTHTYFRQSYLAWDEPDLNGGELVGYDVVRSDGSGTTTERRDAATYPTFYNLCEAPMTVTVRAVTQDEVGDELVGPASELVLGTADPCYVESTLTDQGSPSFSGVALVVDYEQFGPIGAYELDISCRLTVNGASVREGCDREIVVDDLEPDTLYEIQMVIENPDRTTRSNVVVVDTGPAPAPDCTLVPAPAGC